MAAFLEIHASNKLQRAVKDDLTEVHLDGCLALGVIEKYFTSPFIRFPETDTPMAEAHTVYQTVVQQLSALSEDPSCLTNGSAVLFAGVKVHSSVVLDKFLQPEGDGRDHRVHDLLKKLMAAFHVYCTKAFTGHLVDGELTKVSSSETRTVAITNVRSE